jgi:hypothetical protein
MLLTSLIKCMSPQQLMTWHFSLRSESVFMLFLKVRFRPITEKPLSVIMNMTSMHKRCTRRLRTSPLSLPSPRLNHLSFSLTITSAKLGDGSWNGTTEAFIIHWQNQVRLYEKDGPPTDLFSIGQKCIISKTLSIVLMSFMRSRILLTIWSKIRYYIDI